MYIIMYHYVRKIKNSRYPGIKGLEIDYFKQQLIFLKENDFEFVTLKDVVENNISDNSVLLTFDDGYIDHYMNVFPILEQNGISGVFSMPGRILREKRVLDVNKIHYILASANVLEIRDKLLQRMNYYRGGEFDYADNRTVYEKLAVANRFDDKDTIFVKRALQVELPEKLRNLITDELFRQFVTDNEAAFVDELYMSIDQIKTMKRHGMNFAIHGYDHYWMNHLTKDELVSDLTNALDVFDGIVNPADWCCCYPYGSYSDMVIASARQMGATSGLSTDVDIYQPEKHDIFKVPRLDTNDFPPKSDNYKKYKYEALIKKNGGV